MLCAIIRLFIVFLTSFSSAVLASDKPLFIQDRDYKLLANTSTIEQNSVKEFFSYGCPACYRVEPALEQWLTHKPKSITFSRIPVVFHQGWEAYAKAYYIAEAFEIEPKITPKLFAAVQQQGLNLTTGQALADFFTQEGLNPQDFKSAYANSTAIAIKLKQGDEAMKEYGIFEVPTFIVNGRYYTNAAMAKDPKRLIQIIDFLVTKTT